MGIKVVWFHKGIFPMHLEVWSNQMSIYGHHSSPGKDFSIFCGISQYRYCFFHMFRSALSFSPIFFGKNHGKIHIFLSNFFLDKTRPLWQHGGILLGVTFMQSLMTGQPTPTLRFPPQKKGLFTLLRLTTWFFHRRPHHSRPLAISRGGST